MLSESTLFSEDARDRKKYVFFQTFFHRLLVSTLRAILPAIIKIEPTGLQNIPEDCPVVLASNHLTNYDVLILQLTIQRPLFFMTKSELHDNPIVDAVLRNLGAFPVHRGQRDPWAIHHAGKVLEHGQMLVIFPENTRSRRLGLRPGKTDAARLAIHRQCPIVPVGLEDNQDKSKRFPRRTHINLVIGKPIYPDGDESALSLTDRMMFTIADLLPEELRGVYAIKPIGFELF